MAMQTWQTLVNAYQYSGANSGSEKKEFTTLVAVSPGLEEAGKVLTIPASYLQAGSIIRWSAEGVFSCTATPTWKLAIGYGGTAKVLATTAAMKNPEAITNAPFHFHAITRIVSAGVAGKAITLGYVSGFLQKPSETAGAALTPFPNEPSGATLEVEVDTSVAKTVALLAECSASSASNKIQVYHWLVEILN